jgi:hypothetical protein
MSDREDAMATGSTPDDGDELAPTWTHDGHLDEGTIHTWLDGAFDALHAAVIETHVSACAVCSANVAEARGLIAGASRVVRSLDVVPSGVVSQEDAARTASRIVAAALAHAPSGQRTDIGSRRAAHDDTASPDTASPDTSLPASRRAPRPWYLRAEWRAAAALVVMVGGGAYVWSRSPAALPTVTAVQVERGDTFDSAFVPQSSPAMAPSAAPTETLADVRTASPRTDDNRAVPLRRVPDQQAKVAAVPPASAAAPTVGRSEATAMRAVAASETRVAERAAPPAEVVSGLRVAGGVAIPTENRLRDGAVRDSAVRDSAARELVARDVARDVARREGAPERLIVGRIVSQQALPIEGAAVSIVGTTIGVMTDARGDFALRSLGDSASLQVRRLGYESARLSLRTPPNDTARANVTLKASNQTLSAVTVTSESQPLQERRQVGATLVGSPTPAARTAPARAPASAPAAARTMAPGTAAGGRAMQCWVLQPSDPNAADLGSPSPRAVLMNGLSADVGTDRELSSQWVNWPIEGRNTSIQFVRDDRGRYRGTAIGSGVQWTLELTRRGAAWDVLATRAASSVEQKAPALTARYIMTTAADRVCKE